MAITRPVLVIHGGAGSKALSSERKAAIEKSLTGILTEIYPKMRNGMSALEAVTAAVVRLEDDPLYNAGKGSKIQSDGKIRMSAAVMDGNKRRFGGCVNVEGVKNPVVLARALMKCEDRVLSGAGAKRFARELNLEFASPYTAAARRAFAAKAQGKSGTVGAVALDRGGRLAAATSTGGRGYEYPFRVSDSPTTAGNFANGVCAVSATGTGEQIVEFSAASTICAWVEAGMPLSQAVDRLAREAKRARARFGYIALDRKGRIEGVTTTPLLIWGSAGPDGLTIF